MTLRPLLAALAAASLALAGARAEAQCDASDAGDPIDRGTLRDTFPSDQGLDVPTDSPVRFRYVDVVPAGATLCVEAVGRPGCLPGALSVVRDELVWSGAPFEVYTSYRVTWPDPVGPVSVRFRTGRGPSAGPPIFQGIRGASARPVDGESCEAGAFDITVRFSRATSNLVAGTPWPESDVEYVIYSTRGPGIAGPRERDRARLQSSGSSSDTQAQRTFRLGAADSAGPVCFSVQALDPLGRLIANSAEECVNPAEGNYFAGCAATPGARPSRAGWALLALGFVVAGRRRSAVGSRPS